MVNVIRVCRRPLRSTTSPNPPAAQGTKTSRLISAVLLVSTAALAGAIARGSRAPRYSIGFMSPPCYQCWYRHSRVPTSLSFGCNSFGGNSSDHFFQCLNRCRDPGHVTAIDDDLHAKEG